MSTATAEVKHAPDDGGFGIARQSSGGMIDVATTRAAQEVQAAMVIAKRFPRDETASYQRIMQACKRPALAERAMYAYPRGGETVTGPSIRLAEVLAQAWGNINFGVIELDQKNGESTMMSYAWDLETNTRQDKVFTIKHERHKKNGVVTKLTDPRDIYELAANQGARRLRACILGVIPGDVVEAAQAECDKTIEGKNTDPLPDRIRKMVTMFAEIGITQATLEVKLKHKMDATTAIEIRNLGKIFNSIRDGFSSAESHFDSLQPAASEQTADLNAKLKSNDANEKPAQQAASTSAKASPVEEGKSESTSAPAAEAKPADTRPDQTEPEHVPALDPAAKDWSSFVAAASEIAQARKLDPEFFDSAMKSLKVKSSRATRGGHEFRSDWLGKFANGAKLATDGTFAE